MSPVAETDYSVGYRSMSVTTSFCMMVTEEK